MMMLMMMSEKQEQGQITQEHSGEEWNEKIDDVIYPAKTSVDYHLPSRHGRFLSKIYCWKMIMLGLGLGWKMIVLGLGLGWKIIMLKSWSWLKDYYAQVLVRLIMMELMPTWF